MFKLNGCTVWGRVHVHNYVVLLNLDEDGEDDGEGEDVDDNDVNNNYVNDNDVDSNDVDDNDINGNDDNDVADNAVEKFQTFVLFGRHSDPNELRQRPAREGE